MGTKPENGGQSTEKDEQELTYADIMAAMEAGNSEEITRLLADEDEETVEDEATEDNKEPVEESPTEDEPKAEPAKEEENKEAADEPAAEAKTDEDRIAELERELHKARSDAGRVPYIQRRMQELERQVRAAQAAPSTPATTASTQSPQEIEIPPALKKRYDQIRETDPDLADTLEETYKMQVGFASAVSTTSAEQLRREREEAEDREFFMTEKAKLTGMVPQVDQIFAMPEWKAWKESLSPGYRALASSGYADEVVLAVQAFVADFRAARGTDPVPGLSVQQTQEPPVQQQEQSEVQKARQRKVGAAAEVKPAAAKAQEEFDESKAFSELYNRLAKEQGLM